MSEILETVQVVREDHPDGFTEINKCDMTDEDVLYGENTPKKKKGKKDK